MITCPCSSTSLRHGHANDFLPMSRACNETISNPNLLHSANLLGFHPSLVCAIVLAVVLFFSSTPFSHCFPPCILHTVESSLCEFSCLPRSATSCRKVEGHPLGDYLWSVCHSLPLPTPFIMRVKNHINESAYQNDNQSDAQEFHNPPTFHPMLMSLISCTEPG